MERAEPPIGRVDPRVVLRVDLRTASGVAARKVHVGRTVRRNVLWLEALAEFVAYCDRIDDNGCGFFRMSWRQATRREPRTDARGRACVDESPGMATVRSSAHGLRGPACAHRPTIA